MIRNGTSAILEAEVTDLSHDGRGVARVDGKVFFLDDALPGERVRFTRGRRRRSFDTGKTETILSPSPDRVVPHCEYFGTCGGCAMQHLNHPAQIAAKQRQLQDNLKRLGRVEPERYLPPLTGPVWAYRRKARLGVRYVPKKGGVLVGFRERHHSFITPLEHCAVLVPSLARLLPALRELLEMISCRDRIPQIEVAQGDNATALVFRHLVPLTESDRDRIRSFGQQHSVQVMLQPGGLDSITPVWPDTPPLLVYALPDHDVEIIFGVVNFVQVNAAVNEKLVQQALDLLAPRPQERVLDLFCGVGNFSLPLGRAAGEVLGIEGDRALVQRACENAAHNRLANVRFVTADLYADELAGAWLQQRRDKILLDPPRSGALEVVKQLPALSPQRLVYVSCNPATLARDAEIVVRQHGYRFTHAGIIDMFPHTAHVESMAVFERA